MSDTSMANADCRRERLPAVRMLARDPAGGMFPAAAAILGP
jgi:hypothetical protein